MDDLIRREALIEDIVNAFTQRGGSRDDFLKHIQFVSTIDAMHAAIVVNVFITNLRNSRSIGITRLCTVAGP